MSLTPEAKLTALDAIFDGVTVQVILGEESLEIATFLSTDINLTTNVITCSSTFVDGSRIVLSTDGVLSDDLTPGRPVWVVNATGTTFQVSETYDGTPIDFTDQGTGTYTASEVSHSDPVVDGIVYPVRTVADAVRMEIPSYEGQSIRPSVVGSAAVLATDPNLPGTQPEVAQTVLTVPINNGSGANPIEASMVYLITSGSTTPGNTTGTLLDYVAPTTVVVIPQTISDNVPVIISLPEG